MKNSFTYSALIEDKTGKIFPVYFLEGEDEYLIKDSENHLVSKILGSSDLKDFNYSKLICSKDLKASDINSVCLEFPVFSKRRIVYLENIQKMSDSEKDILAAYIKNVYTDTVIIISNNSSPFSKGKSPLGKKLESCLKEIAAHIQCYMNEREIEEWMIANMKRYGFELRHDAVGILRKRTNSDLFLISTELLKLRAFCDPRKIVSRQDIEAISSYTPQAQMYQITDSIFKGNADAAITAFHEMVSTSDPTVTMLNYINRAFMGMLEANKAFNETGSIREAAHKLKKPEYVIRKNIETSSLLTENNIQRITELLLLTDMNIKKGKDIIMSFELLFIHMSALFKKRASV